MNYEKGMIVNYYRQSVKAIKQLVKCESTITGFNRDGKINLKDGYTIHPDKLVVIGCKVVCSNGIVGYLYTPYIPKVFGGPLPDYIMYGNEEYKKWDTGV